MIARSWLAGSPLQSTATERMFWLSAAVMGPFSEDSAADGGLAEMTAQNQTNRTQGAQGLIYAAQFSDAAGALREAAENALATLDNVLLHHAKDMTPGDQVGRRRVADELRKALAAMVSS